MIVVEGNHDKITDKIVEKKDIKFVENYIIDDVFICHGDKIVDMPKKIKKIIIGHEHPAISITDGNKVEKYKCFVKCKFEKKDLYVLPSFNFVTEGTDISKESLLSPYLKKIKEFEITVTQDSELYYFGKIKREV